MYSLDSELWDIVYETYPVFAPPKTSESVRRNLITHYGLSVNDIVGEDKVFNRSVYVGKCLECYQLETDMTLTHCRECGNALRWQVEGGYFK